MRAVDAVLRARGYDIIHCLGDSHVRVFRHAALRSEFRRTQFRVTAVGGATAMGVVNPNSSTNALVRFRSALTRIPPTDTLLTLLGEVDCGFVIWYRAGKYRESVESQFELSLQRYQEFLSELRRSGYTKVVVCSAPLPTIADGQTWGEVANARREVSVTQLRRTQLTLEYNARMASYCEMFGLTYLDLDSSLLDTTTSLIRRELLSSDPLDHHLAPGQVAPLLARSLRSLGYE